MKSRSLVTVEEVADHPAGCIAGDRTRTVVHGGLDLFLEKHGCEGAERVMLDLCFLITEVRRITLEILARQEAKIETEPCIREISENAVTQKLRPLGR